MYEELVLLKNALNRYESGDKNYRENIFPEIVVFALRTIGLEQLAEEVEKNPEKAYPTARRVVKNFFSLKNEPRMIFSTLRNIYETIRKQRRDEENS